MLNSRQITRSLADMGAVLPATSPGLSQKTSTMKLLLEQKKRAGGNPLPALFPHSDPYPRY